MALWRAIGTYLTSNWELLLWFHKKNCTEYNKKNFSLTYNDQSQKQEISNLERKQQQRNKTFLMASHTLKRQFQIENCQLDRSETNPKRSRPCYTSKAEQKYELSSRAFQGWWLLSAGKHRLEAGSGRGRGWWLVLI